MLESSNPPTAAVASSIKQPHVAHSVHHHQANSPHTYYENVYGTAPIPGSAIHDAVFLARAGGYAGHISQQLLSVQQPPVGDLAAQLSNATDSMYYNVPNLSHTVVPTNTLHGVTGPPASIPDASYYDRTPPIIQQPSLAHSLGGRPGDSSSEALSGPYSLFRSSPMTPAPRSRPFQAATNLYNSQLFGNIADAPLSVDSMQHTPLHQPAHISPLRPLESPLGLAQGQPGLTSRGKARCKLVSSQWAAGRLE